MNRRDHFQSRAQFEQEHQPMGLSLVTLFAHDSRHGEVFGSHRESQFLARFPGCTGMRGFSRGTLQFPAGWGPKSPVGILESLKQQNFVGSVEAVQQSGNAMGKPGHPFSQAEAIPRDKPPEEGSARAETSKCTRTVRRPRRHQIRTWPARRTLLRRQPRFPRCCP